MGTLPNGMPWTYESSVDTGIGPPVTDIHAEYLLLVEMLERLATALHHEARAPRMSRHNIGAAANNLTLVVKQLRQLPVVDRA